MRTQQLATPTTTVRRPALRPIALLSLGALAVLLTALLIARSLEAPAPQAARGAGQPVATLPGGHPTGSVYDGGAYGAHQAPAWSPAALPGGHPTGSAYDGGAYGRQQVPAWSPATLPGGHPTGSVYDGN